MRGSDGIQPSFNKKSTPLSNRPTVISRPTPVKVDREEKPKESSDAYSDDGFEDFSVKSQEDGLEVPERSDTPKKSEKSDKISALPMYAKKITSALSSPKLAALKSASLNSKTNGMRSSGVASVVSAVMDRKPTNPFTRSMSDLDENT